MFRNLDQHNSHVAVRSLSDMSSTACFSSYLVTSAKEVTFSSAFVSLFINKITQKLLNRFSQNQVERWRMRHGRNHQILVLIRSAIRQGQGTVKQGYRHTPYLFNSNNLATSAALAEVCALLSGFLVSSAYYNTICIDSETIRNVAGVEVHLPPPCR